MTSDDMDMDDALALIRAADREGPDGSSTFIRLLNDMLDDYEDISDLVIALSFLGHEIARIVSIERGTSIDEVFNELNAQLIEANLADDDEDA